MTAVLPRPATSAAIAVDMVSEFHAAFAHPVADEHPSPAKGRWPKTWQLRLALIAEEYGELVTAVTAGDDRSVADALADLVYVIVGTAVVYGTPHVALMQRYVIGQAGDTVAAFGQQRHPAGWPMRLSAFARAYASLVDAIDAGDTAGTANELASLHRQCISIAALYGIPLDAMVAEAHRSNMSKLGADGLPVYRSDGKVAKGPNYVPPDLHRALAAHHLACQGPTPVTPEEGGRP